MRQQAGFTIIELIVTIVVAGIFIGSIYSMLTLITKLSIASSQSFTANSLSYANMRKYANGRSPSWFVCPASPALETDPVTVLSSTSAVDGLPPPTSQTVVADAPYGCTSASGLAVRITSTVTYGPNNVTMKNVSYANY